jgi:zinc transport system ATP-binding protein
MDEPTAGVDLASQEILSQVLARLAGRGATMLVVTHELQAVRSVLTRIVELHGGRITLDATPADYARSQGTATTNDNGHHHDAEEPPPAFPASGPLDNVNHLSGGHGA